MRMSLSSPVPDEGLVLRFVEVGRHRELAARLDQVPQRVRAVPRHPPLAEWVSPVGMLDLDDLRAEVREQAAGEGSCNQCPEFQTRRSDSGSSVSPCPEFWTWFQHMDPESSGQSPDCSIHWTGW